MKNVGMKAESYRTAIAIGTLHAPPHCIELLRHGNTEKGDALKTARIAGILGAKRTVAHSTLSSLTDLPCRC